MSERSIGDVPFDLLEALTAEGHEGWFEQYSQLNDPEVSAYLTTYLLNLMIEHEADRRCQPQQQLLDQMRAEVSERP